MVRIWATGTATEKSKAKHLWENEGPKRSAADLTSSLIPAWAAGGLLDVRVTDISGMDGSNGLGAGSIREAPYLELLLGCEVQAVSAPVLLSLGRTSSGTLLPTMAAPPPQAFQVSLLEGHPQDLLIAIHKRKKGQKDKLVAMAHVPLSAVFKGGWHNFNLTLVSYKGLPPGNVRVSLNFRSPSKELDPDSPTSPLEINSPVYT
eukprot:jgi/Mesen1/4164/ME000219S03296